MTTDIRIRTAHVEDLEAVRSLLVATWHDTYDPLVGWEKVEALTKAWHASEVLAQQLDGAETSFLVAESENCIVGHAFADARRPPILLLGRLYVLPARQRCGIGARLLATVIDRHLSFAAMQLHVEAENAKAVEFYRSQDFEIVGRSSVEGIDTLQMQRTLG